MDPVILIVTFLFYSILAGLLGALAMSAAMMLIWRPLSGGSMIVAVGSLLTKSRENARLVGLTLHALSGIGFGMLYTLILMALEMNAWPLGFFAGLGLGLFHGLCVSLALVWIVAGQHPLPEYNSAGPAVFLSHFAGHVAYGGTVGLVVALAPV